MVSCSDVKAWLSKLSEIYTDKKEYLTELDSAIGDADHGINLERGFSAIKKDLDNKEYSSIAALLKAEAMILIKTVGGASGPLLGTCFLQMSKASVSDNAADAKEIAVLSEQV